MKRSSHDGDTIVIQWGIPSWAPIPDELAHQFHLAHRYRNHLTELARAHDDRLAEVWRTDPDVATAIEALDGAVEALDDARAAAKADRVTARTTTPTAATRSAITEARTHVKAARKALKDAKKDAKPRLADQLKAADDEHHEALRVARASDGPWKQAGLGWGTVNDINDRHRQSHQQVIAARTSGKRAEHRFRRWDAPITITVQNMLQTGKPRRIEWELVDGRPASEWTGKPRRREGQPSSRHQTFRLRIGRTRQLDPTWVELPVVVHRPLPCDPSDVSYVSITRRMIAGGPKLTVQLTCLIPTPEPRTSGGTVTARLHWDNHEGRLRALRLGSSRPLPDPPPSIRHLVKVADDGLAADAYLDPAWRQLLERDAHIRSHRDDLLNDLKEHLRPQLPVDVTRRDGNTETVTWGDVQRRRSPGWFARLAIDWPPDHPAADALEAWRQRDKHLWLYEAHERDQVIASRRDTWRNVAAWVTSEAQAVAVVNVDVAGLRRQPDVDRADPERARHSRAQIQAVAPYELRQAIEQAAARRGVDIIDVKDEHEGAS